MLTSPTSSVSAAKPVRSLLARKIEGLVCVALGSVVFVWWGLALQLHSPNRFIDFRVIYYNVKVLLNHNDPYNTLNGEKLAMDDGDKPKVHPVLVPSEITCVYPPSALLVDAPLGLLSRVPAQLTWAVLNGVGLILSGFLLWDIAAEAAPLLAGALLGFLLANSAGLLFQGNVAGIVVSLCVITTWCFFRDRYIPLAIACMAISLAIKPHDSGFVWLSLLFTRRHRRPAIYALLLTLFLLATSVVWVTRVAPSWRSELKANLDSVSARGSGNDPGPTSGSSTIVNSDVNFQAIVAVIKDEPSFYNPVSYLFCAGLLTVWAIPAWRITTNPFRFWVAMAFMSALTMLPVYHRHHDAKLLMLAVPACALVWSRNRRLGVAAIAVTGLAIAATADVPRALLTLAESSIQFSTATVSGKFVTILLARPAPLSITLMATFYLWVYWRETCSEVRGLSSGRTA